MCTGSCFNQARQRRSISSPVFRSYGSRKPLGAFGSGSYVAAIQIIIYAGAILVLFLFVLMLLNLKQEETAKKYQGQWPISAGIAIVFAIFLTMIVGKITVMPPLGEYSIEAIQAEGSMMTIGKVLYTKYLLPFEIASLILLVALIGAVVLAKKRIEN